MPNYTTARSLAFCYFAFISKAMEPQKSFCQRRIFIFGAPGCFKLGAFLESSRRLMSYKLALHLLTIFTEQAVSIHKHITLFWIPSISGTKTVTMKLTKKAAVKLSDRSPITYLLSTSLASCNLKIGFRRFVPHVIRNNNQCSRP